MLIVSETALQQAMQSLVMTTHTATDTKGKRYTLGTIHGPTLRAATLAALGIICRTPVDTVLPDALPDPL